MSLLHVGVVGQHTVLGLLPESSYFFVLILPLVVVHPGLLLLLGCSGGVSFWFILSKVDFLASDCDGLSQFFKPSDLGWLWLLMLFLSLLISDVVTSDDGWAIHLFVAFHTLDWLFVLSKALLTSSVSDIIPTYNSWTIHLLVSLHALNWLTGLSELGQPVWIPELL